MRIQSLYCYMTILIYLKEYEDFDITDPKAFLFRGIVDARSLKFQESWRVTELSRYLFPICLLFVIRSCDTELGQLPCSFFTCRTINTHLFPACYLACSRFQREEYVSLSNGLIPSRGNIATLRLGFFSWQLLASLFIVREYSEFNGPHHRPSYAFAPSSCSRH
jgi:hypothetical protein